MKKRKRKLSKNKHLTAANCSSHLLIQLILKPAAISIVICVVFFCKPNESLKLNTSNQSDEDHLLDQIPSIASKSSPTIVNTLIKEQAKVASMHLENDQNSPQATTNSSSQISSNGTVQQEETISLLDDLLAVESGGNRLLTIGKSSTSPPYANEKLNASDINFRFRQIKPLNDSQLAKIYRSPPFPLLIRRPVGVDPNRPHLIRLVQVSPVARHQQVAGTKLTTYRVGNQQQQQQPTVNLLPVARQSPYLPFANQNNIGKQAEEVQFSAGRQSEFKSVPAANVSPFEFPIADNQPASVIAEESNKTHRQEDQFELVGVDNGKSQVAAHGSPGNSKFPSLISSLNGNAEDDFERSISSGQYQRTNPASNLTWTQLLRQATESNIMESLMVTNKTIVSLLCEPNYMLIRFKFRQPFKGLVYTNQLNKPDSCSILGTGGQNYEMRIPLNECGTFQEIPRLFINNIHIQFHQTTSKLDIADEELKTLVCSYPIRPRAPPPADLPAGLPERIVEVATSSLNEQQPAKLVYYEPLLLISGLLLLSITLLGLTTSAYLFTRRLRGSSRSFTGGAFGSAKANQPHVNLSLVAPPLIGMTDNKRQVRGEAGRMRANKSSTPPQKPRRTRLPESKQQIEARRIGKKYADDFVGNNRASKDERNTSDSISPVTERATTGAKSVKAAEDGISDSLADKNERHSVTTIEIPFSGKIKSSPLPTSSSSSSVIIAMPPEAPLSSSAGMQTNETSANTNMYSPLPNFGLMGEQVDLNRQQERNKMASGSRVTLEGSHGKVKSMKAARKAASSKLLPKKQHQASSKSIEVQVDRPPFGSLRSTLTSPRQYRRLQRISELFDEVLIKSQVDRGSEEGSVLVYSRQLSPSKYKERILDQVEEEQRQLVSSMLYEDEVLRSLVVESTNKETFVRKLRKSPVYGHKLKAKTWNLLEDILLDPEFDGSGSQMNQVQSVAGESKLGEASLSSTEAKQFDEDGVKLKATLKTTSGEQVDVVQNPEVARKTKKKEPTISESVLAEAEASHLTDDQRSLGNQDSLESSTDEEQVNIERLIDSERSNKEPPEIGGPNSSSSWTTTKIEGRDTVRVSQFNSSRSQGGATGTLINIDSVTTASSKDFSSFTRSSIEHTRYSADDSLPYLDEEEREEDENEALEANYEYAKETNRHSPRLSRKRVSISTPSSSSLSANGLNQTTTKPTYDISKLRR